MFPTCARGPGGTPCGNVPGKGEAFKSGHPNRGAHCIACWRAREPAKPQPPPRRTLCIHLGTLVSERKGSICGRIYTCEKGHGEVCPNKECRRCTDYEPDV